jgi:ABC-type multidrug transport system fused ATPase/permease subunit
VEFWRAESKDNTTTEAKGPVNGQGLGQHDAVGTENVNDDSPSTTSGEDDNSIVLSIVNLNIKSGELVAVCGVVGSGKSSLCSALLGSEMTCVSGSVHVAGKTVMCECFGDTIIDINQMTSIIHHPKHPLASMHWTWCANLAIYTFRKLIHILLTTGKVAFCAQESFILNATVRENITFGKEFDQGWYEHVVHVCALESDLAILP